MRQLRRAAPGAYCPSCGQDTRERLPTFAQFMREATGRYVALDGKLWKTLVALLFRPGLLTREYLAGRRRRYIGPARLFLVSSLVLFAALRFVSESINIEDAVQFEPETAPRSGVESDETDRAGRRPEAETRRSSVGVGALAQADREVQRPSPRGEAGADPRRRVALRPVCDVRAAPGVREPAEAAVSRAPRGDIRRVRVCTASTWSSPRTITRSCSSWARCCAACRRDGCVARCGSGSSSTWPGRRGQSTADRGWESLHGPRCWSSRIRSCSAWSPSAC